MRVLQINTVCGAGSTGRSCVELARVLSQNGHECHVAFGQGTTRYPNSSKIGSRFENHLHNVCSRLFGNQGYYSQRGTLRLIRHIETLRPDIIHLRNLHGNYLNLKVLFDFLAKADIPVVWTLHDCWAFTGKCVHYTQAQCEKWKTACGRCPQYRQYPPSLFFDRSEGMHADKRRWFTSVRKMVVVPVSDWLAGEVRQSFLGMYPVTPIYNWVDLDVFKPRDSKSNSKCRAKYGIAESAFVVLGVSARWSDRAHVLGGYKLDDFQKLQTSLARRDAFRLVLVGKASDPGSMPRGAVQIPYVDSTAELAEIYSMADVYVHASVEDTFGKVIGEALACGTPAIVYNSTACPEVVGPGCGYVVEARNVEQVAERVVDVVRCGKLAYSDRCVAFCRSQYDMRTNAGAYLQLYREVLSQ